MRNLSRDLCRPSGMAHERQALGGSAATWITEDRTAPPWHAWHAYSAAEKALAEHRSFHGLKPFIPSPWRLADPSSRMGPSPSASPIPVRFESSQLSNALYNFSCALQFSGARRRRARGGGVTPLRDVGERRPARVAGGARALPRGAPPTSGPSTLALSAPCTRDSRSGGPGLGLRGWLGFMSTG